MLDYIAPKVRQLLKSRYFKNLFILFIFLINYAFVYYSTDGFTGFIKKRVALNTGEESKDDVYRQIELRVYGEPKEQTDQCILPKLDPWDPALVHLMQRPPPTVCNVTFFKLTTLENGVLKVLSNNATKQTASDCSFRCLHAVNDYEMKVDNWTKLDITNGSKPGCDIVEVECKQPVNYTFIHTQIVENQKPNVTAKDPKNQPDVFWIILDSTSMSMVKRAMNATRKVLADKFEVIEFPHMNKVKLNSRPNSYTMFFGSKYDYKSDVWCKQALDDKDFIGFDFQKAGYLTHQTEDWAKGVVNHPNCIGFKRKQVDHFMRPFWLRLDGAKEYYNRLERDQMLAGSCKQWHDYPFEHFLQFADSYKDQPKFSFMWIVQIAHGSNLPLFEEDVKFAELFESLHKKLNNSFLFFQSDHGLRTGQIREVPTIGEIEERNPFLFVSVPKHLRKNKSLMKQMTENSKQLISHLDVHATLFQIAKFSHEWNETTNFDQPMPTIQNRTIHGSSLFHKLKQPRNCESLHIPFIYCSCSQNARLLNDTTLALKVAQFLIDYMNKDLEDPDYVKLCHKHTLSSKYPVKLEEFNAKEAKARVLRAWFKTLPGDAFYQGYLHDDQKITVVAPFYRLDPYAEQAKCISPQFMQNYCVCKK